MELESSKIKGIIFDIDGTILDSMLIWKDLSSNFLKGLGITAEDNLNQIMYTMSLREGYAYLKEHYKLSLSENEIKYGIFSLLKDFYHNQVSAKAGAVKLIKSLAEKNIPMVLATTGDEELSGPALERLNLLKYFKALLSCNQLNTNKGHPLVFYKAVEILTGETNLNDYKDYFVVEDSLKPITTAKQAGFSTIAVEDGSAYFDKVKIKQTADFYVQSLEEINII